MKKHSRMYAGILGLTCGGWITMTSAEVRFSVGVSRQAGMEVEVRESGSYTQTSDLSPYWPWRRTSGASSQIGARPRPGQLALPVPDDDLSTTADRTFDDGFVHRDVWTDDPEVPEVRQGITWNWGYDQPGQYDPQNQTLTYRRTSSAQRRARSEDVETTTRSRSRVSTERNDSLSLDDDMESWTLDVMADVDVVRRESWSAEMRFGLSLFGSTKSSWKGASTAAFRGQEVTEQVARNTRNGFLIRRQMTEVYTYADPWGVVPSVTAPYAGPDDPVGGPGPVIPNQPVSREIERRDRVVQTSSQTTTRRSVVATRQVQMFNRIDYHLDVDYQRMWINPRLTMDAAQSLRLFVGPVLSLTYADATLKRREDLLVKDGNAPAYVAQSWADRKSETSWLPGLGFSVGGSLSLSDAWFLELSGAWEWIDSMTIQAGPGTATVDLGNWSLSAGIGRTL
ncbi:MAG TPA: hypothetical protein PKE55_09585 [Kiritimatiellia bacterium]|nr:hypothetical protein [Kiritimatiellia bacterium]